MSKYTIKFLYETEYSKGADTIFADTLLELTTKLLVIISRIAQTQIEEAKRHTIDDDDDIPF